MFAAVLCAYEGAHGGSDAARAAGLEREMARVRGMFRAAGVAPRPCSDPVIGRLAGCIRVGSGAGEIVSEWRTGPGCSSADLAPYR